MQSNSLDLLHQIRATANDVYRNSLHVSINEERLVEFAHELATLDLDSLRKGVSWDACGWHYNADVSTIGPLTCQYVFVMDALNFCFWPVKGLEYDTLASSLKHVISHNHEAFNAANLATLKEAIIFSANHIFQFIYTIS
jgi:hypothetical protein